jgi:hypothetical protein
MRAPCARLPLMLLALAALACTGSEELTDPMGPDLAAATAGSRLLQWVAPTPPFATPASSGSYSFGTVAVKMKEVVTSVHKGDTDALVANVRFLQERFGADAFQLEAVKPAAARARPG